MPSTFEYSFDTPSYKGKIALNTGLFIGGKFVDPVEGGTHDVINPSTSLSSTTHIRNAILTCELQRPES